MRFRVFLFALCSFFICAYSEPPREIPPDLLDQFTMNGKIPIFDWYLDHTFPESAYQLTLADGTSASFYSKEIINSYVNKVNRKEAAHYGITDFWLYEALEKYSIYGKDISIVGSITPWYESVVIAYGGRPTTIEYNKSVDTFGFTEAEFFGKLGNYGYQPIFYLFLSAIEF